MRFIKWLYPGLGVKRWMFLALGGIVLCMVGTILLVAAIFPLTRAEILLQAEYWLGPVSRWPWVLLIPFLGLLILALGIYIGFRSLLVALAPISDQSVLDVLYSRRYLRRGPKIVVIGGGTGLSTLLRGLKNYTSNITAIVSVADDGGSSGKLRADLGILAPGDIRNCIVALADKEPLMEALLQYRFHSGELSGHSMGNLLLAALNDLTGEFYQAVQGMNRVLAIRGRVLPVTLQNVTLGAEFSDGNKVQGESAIPKYGKKIRRIFLEPADCYPLPEALEAILDADAVVLGPGSLYTSVLPNLVVHGMGDVLARSPAIKIYVCNIMTQKGETDGYSASKHLEAIVAQVGDVVDYMLVNTGQMSKSAKSRYRKEGATMVQADIRQIEKMGVRVITGNFMQEDNVVRHHAERIAKVLVRLTLAKRKVRMKYSLKNKK